MTPRPLTAFHLEPRRSPAFSRPWFRESLRSPGAPGALGYKFRILILPLGLVGAAATAPRGLQIADARHHGVSDAFEGPQHELVLADDVADHHVVEAHVTVSAKTLDNGIGVAHE
jgi:hypothetical protein